MSFKFYIANTLLSDEPNGWQDMTTTLRLDKELKGLFSVMDTSLTFYGDGHDILQREYLANGYCHKLTFEVRQDNGTGNYYPIFTGFIFLRDVEFTEGINGTFAKTQIQDNSFYAKIFNNKNLKAKIYAGISKNGASITPAVFYRMNYFTPSTGTYATMYFPSGSNAKTVACFKVYDVLKYLVDFITDGTVTFVSDTFGVGGKYENYYITIGYLIRFAIPGGTTEQLFRDHWPEISLADCIEELNKEFNTGFVAAYTGSTGTFRIEEYGYLFPTNIIDSLTDIDSIKHKTASPYIYGSMDVGSETVTNESFLSFLDVRYLGWTKESYPFLGECNTDRVLDLVNTWIVDSNTIEDLVVNGQTTAPTSFDENIFLIQASFDTGNIVTADQSNWINSITPPFFYNETLINQAKVQRHLGSMPNSIVQYFAADTNRFRAGLTTNFIVPAPIAGYNPAFFDDDTTPPNFDAGGNYDIVNFNFTNTITGVLSFFAHIDIQTGLAAQRLRIRLVRWDAGLTTIQGVVIMYDQIIDAGVYALDLSGAIYSASTEKIDIQIEYQTDGAATVYTSSYWECTNAGEGGEFATAETENYYVIHHIFSNYPFQKSRFDNIATDPRGLLGIAVNMGKTYYAGIEELKYNHYREEIVNAILLSNESVNE